MQFSGVGEASQDKRLQYGAEENKITTENMAVQSGKPSDTCDHASSSSMYHETSTFSQPLSDLTRDGKPYS